MNDEKNLGIKINPTSNTAITTLIMLANAHYEKALAILEQMGVDKETIFHGVDPTDMVNRPSDIVRELRYVALNRTIEESGLKVLKQFREAGEGITGIHVDVSKMAYVSSAGLRVFLMMYKSLEDKDSFKMTGINAAVRDILETTGFDSLLNLVD